MTPEAQMPSELSAVEAARAAFTEVYGKDVWVLEKNHTPEQIQNFVDFLQGFIDHNAIKTASEFGCGYFRYSGLIDWTGIRYDGYDVVEGIIKNDQQNKERENIKFHLLKDGMEIKGGDLLICKDVLQHLPNKDVIYYLGLFRRLYKILLITNDVVPDARTNEDIAYGDYRAIRLDQHPFNAQAAVLHEWRHALHGVPTVKHTCLLFGDAGAGPDAREALRLGA
jgi:hypothetical protein